MTDPLPYPYDGSRTKRRLGTSFSAQKGHEFSGIIIGNARCASLKDPSALPTVEPRMFVLFID